MAITRSQLVKELEPGLNALFGMEYKRYENEHEEIFFSFWSNTCVSLTRTTDIVRRIFWERFCVEDVFITLISILIEDERVMF